MVGSPEWKIPLRRAPDIKTPCAEDVKSVWCLWKTPPKVEIVKASWYDKRRSLPKKLLSNIMRNGDVTMSGNLQVADFKRTFPSPHGRQDAQEKQVSLQGEKEWRILNGERLGYSSCSPQS